MPSRMPEVSNTSHRGGFRARAARGCGTFVVVVVFVVATSFLQVSAGSRTPATAPTTRGAPKDWETFFVWVISRSGAEAKQVSLPELISMTGKQGEAIQDALADSIKDVPREKMALFVRCLTTPGLAVVSGKLQALTQREFVFHLWDAELFHAEVEELRAFLRYTAYGFVQSPPNSDEERVRVVKQLDAMLNEIRRQAELADFDHTAVDKAIQEQKLFVEAGTGATRFGIVARPISEGALTRVSEAIRAAFSRRPAARPASPDADRRFVSDLARRLMNEYFWRTPPGLSREEGGRRAQLSRAWATATSRKGELLQRLEHGHPGPATTSVPVSSRPGR
jgi:hypothetical protein